MKKEKKEMRRYWYSCKGTNKNDSRVFSFSGFLYAVSIDDAYKAVSDALGKSYNLSVLDMLSILIEEGL